VKENTDDVKLWAANYFLVPENVIIWDHFNWNYYLSNINKNFWEKIINAFKSWWVYAVSKINIPFSFDFWQWYDKYKRLLIKNWINKIAEKEKYKIWNFWAPFTDIIDYLKTLK